MEYLKRLYYDFVSKIVFHVAQAIDDIRVPFTKKKVKYKHVLESKSLLKKGDIILTRTMGELTTFLIPGHWKHGMVYGGNGKVIEATRIGVHESYLEDALMKTDQFAILRVKGITEDKVDIFYSYAELQIGKAYDFGLKVWDEDSQYCTEILYHGLNKSMGKGFVVLRETLGFPTFTPDDCYKASKKFDIIYQRRK